MTHYIKSLLVLFVCALSVQAQKIEFQSNPQTGAIARLNIANDERKMNWILHTDGSQYAWVKDNYGWGLGFFTENADGKSADRIWQKPLQINAGGTEVVYKEGAIRINVKRTYQGGDLIESYSFTNESENKVSLSGIGINTPFNDNYPDAATCYRERAHTHIWAGNNAAYINATHMSGNAPHLGLILTEGSINTYEIKERARENTNSNFRGVIILNPEDIRLQPNETYTLSWRIFTHNGNDDFYKKIIDHGSVLGRSNKYVYEQEETAFVEFEHAGDIREAKIKLNGKTIPHKKHRNTFTAEAKLNELGEAVFELEYADGKRTPVHCLVISGEKELIQKRAAFIVENQQLNDTTDKRHGAYMVYDNELNKIYLNDTPNCNPVDRDEGRERLGMGVLLAMIYNQSEEKNESLKQSLTRYADFVHKLQDKDYNTFSNTDLTGWNRNYNYSWVAHFYFEMFHVTGEKQFLLDGYHTLKALYRNFGHNFYAIGMPFQGYNLLLDNGFQQEAASLLNDFTQIAETYLRNGYNYPISEVNYEQSIVAPSVSHLLQMYLLTKEEKYLEGAKKQLPLLEAFGCFQPSYHINEISIRHWDGYWFGKREMWGDNYPHYWSTLTAMAYHLYAEATGDQSYKKRAENIVRNNLCLFSEDGKASCAFVYPQKVNGEEAYFYDPYANDQDWALVFYLLVNKKNRGIETQL